MEMDLAYIGFVGLCEQDGREPLNEGTFQRLVGNTRGIADFGKNLVQGNGIRNSVQQGHESRYGSIAAQYASKILGHITKFSQHL